MANIKPTYVDDDSGQLREQRTADSVLTPLKTQELTSSELETTTIISGETVYDTDEDRGVFGPLKRYLVGIRDTGKKINTVADLEGDTPSWFETLFSATPKRDMLGYNSVGDGGGDTIYWDADRDKQDHDGGKVFSPTHNNSAWGDTDDDNWFEGDPDDTGTGVWVRDIGVATANQYGAQADYDGGVDDFNALNTLLNNNSIVDLEEGRYGISDTIDTDSITIHSNNAEIHVYPPHTNYAIRVGGSSPSEVEAKSVGTYHNLTADVLRGENALVNSSLASEVESGNLVKIVSDKTRAQTPTEIGEMQTVLFTTSDTVYLSGALNDSYLASDNVRAAKVTPNQFNTVGKLKIVHHPEDEYARCQGMQLNYCENTEATLEFLDCGLRSLMVQSCFNPDITLFSYNSHQLDTDLDRATNSYGLNITNTTMNGTFRGVVSGAKHCVSIGGGPAHRGISWNNTINMVGYGVGHSAVFDAHIPVGSIYYENCKAITGDVINSSGNPNNIAGYVLSAKRNYIKDCYYSGNSHATGTRGGEIEKFHVDGLEVDGEGGTIHNENNSNDTIVEEFSFNNIIANTDRGFNFSENGATTTEFRDWSFSNIIWNSNSGVDRFFNDNGNIVTPDVYKFDNLKLNQGNEGGAISELIFANQPNKVYIFNNSEISDVSMLIRVQQPIDRIEFNDCNIRNINYGLFNLDGTGADVGLLQINGGHYSGFGNDWIGNTGNNSITDLVVSGATILDVITLIWGSSGSTQFGIEESAAIGANNMPSVTDIARNYGTNYTEIFNGGQGVPFFSRGSGSPEGVVVAPPGCIYTDSTGGTDTLYVKLSGLSNTGWVAK